MIEINLKIKQMKIKVEVDVQEILNEMFEDFNPHEDSFELDLKETIKDGIVGDVKRQIIQLHSKEITAKIVSEAKSLIDLEISETIKKEVQEFAKNGKLNYSYSKEEDMTVQQWINHHFEKKSNDFTNLLKKVVQTNSKHCVDEIKSRYDLLFASQVITKLNDQDLLKEGVFKALMSGNN